MRVNGMTLAVVAALVAAPAMAANARHPYANVDHNVDQGNPTGNSQVDELNQQQLDGIHAQNQSAAKPPMLGAPLYTPVVPASKGLSQ